MKGGGSSRHAHELAADHGSMSEAELLFLFSTALKLSDCPFAKSRAFSVQPRVVLPRNERLTPLA